MSWFKKLFKKDSKPASHTEPEAQASVKHSPDEIKETPVKQEPKDTQKKEPQKAAKYHVSQNKDEKSEHFKMWRVRKEGSQKTIQYFKTQKEAIDFAQSLADRHQSSVVIHKVDGSIRKQHYK